MSLYDILTVNNAPSANWKNVSVNDLTVYGKLNVTGSTGSNFGNITVQNASPNISIINDSVNSNRATLTLSGMTGLSGFVKLQQSNDGTAILENFNTNSDISLIPHGGSLYLPSSSNQIKFNSNNIMTLNVSAPTGNTTVTMPDPLASSNLLYDTSSTGLPVTARKYTQFANASLPTGLTTLYTCPSTNKSATIYASLFNPNATTVNYTLSILRSSTTYIVTPLTAVAQNARSSPAFGFGLNAGDALQITCDNPGLVCIGSTILVPLTNPINSVYAIPTQVSTGIYTCPNNMNAYSTSLTGSNAFVTLSGMCINQTGGAITLTISIFKTLTSTTYTITQQSVANNTSTSINLGCVLTPSDQILIRSSVTSNNQVMAFPIQEVTQIV